MSRIYLSPPDVGDSDRLALLSSFDSGWIAPVGPDLEAFERALAARVGRRFAVALASGTAAIHLALLEAGIGSGDRVAVQSLTFAATANAVTYVGARPVFIDSEDCSWNLDPSLLEDALTEGRRIGDPIRAVISVDIYGQCADYSKIAPLCSDFDISLIEDAAEALGASHATSPAGSFGQFSVLSFNGNKIITTSGGGALLTDDRSAADHVRKLATQAREPLPHYEHTEIGYNYRLSNLLAALGVSQLADLDRRVAARRENNRLYRQALGELPGITFMPEAPGSTSTFWLTALTIDPAEAGFDREELRQELEKQDIEARPLWKPMHLQPAFSTCDVIGGTVSSRLFDRGLCLPSGSNLSPHDLERVVATVLRLSRT